MSHNDRLCKGRGSCGGVSRPVLMTFCFLKLMLSWLVNNQSKTIAGVLYII